MPNSRRCSGRATRSGVARAGHGRPPASTRYGPQTRRHSPSSATTPHASICDPWGGGRFAVGHLSRGITRANTSVSHGGRTSQPGRDYGMDHRSGSREHDYGPPIRLIRDDHRDARSSSWPGHRLFRAGPLKISPTADGYFSPRCRPGPSQADVTRARTGLGAPGTTPLGSDPRPHHDGTTRLQLVGTPFGSTNLQNLRAARNGNHRRGRPVP